MVKRRRGRTGTEWQKLSSEVIGRSKALDYVLKLCISSLLFLQVVQSAVSASEERIF